MRRLRRHRFKFGDCVRGASDRRERPSFYLGTTDKGRTHWRVVKSLDGLAYLVRDTEVNALQWVYNLYNPFTERGLADGRLLHPRRTRRPSHRPRFSVQRCSSQETAVTPEEVAQALSLARLQTVGSDAGRELIDEWLVKLDEFIERR